ncbi:hypothetical protein hrd7_28150 [Leptolinea sp. HRD-7]|nr:hypothetical protein hrd7_28150 [Leptolinea sp. HRD-7]
MSRFRWLSITIACFLLALTTTNAYAQTYLFQVDSLDVSVYANTDGTSSIDYQFVFTNNPKASPIDYVDVGVPNSSYSLSNVSAEIDGSPITDIQHSEYVSPRVALGLGPRSIPPGKTGTVHVRINNVERVFYPSTAEGVENYASLEFSPTWFGSEYVTGSTKVTVTLFLPPGINPEEPRYHAVRGGFPGSAEPESGYDEEGRVFYRWTSDTANAHTQYTFGASFPAKLIPAESIVKEPPIKIDFEDICCGAVVLGFIGSFIWGIYEAIWGAQKRKLQYLPPKISVEGHGIKRGLTAVEAAVLMEQPVDKVMTMILFGLVKKNAAAVISKDPMTIKAVDPLPEGLQEYEKSFLEAFNKADKKERTRALQTMIIDLVKSIGEKMKGFSRKETIAYYKDIMERAWAQVETADTPTVKMEKFDQYMDWTMLDDKFGDKTREVFRTEPVYLPTWWGRYDPTYSSSSSSGGGLHSPSAPSSSGSGGGMQLPSLPGADFAASMVGGIQNFSSKVVGDLTSFTSGVTEKTNPVPVSRSSNYRGGGGGGGCACACACACAGCACACAGGGR